MPNESLTKATIQKCFILTKYNMTSNANAGQNSDRIRNLKFVQNFFL